MRSDWHHAPIHILEEAGAYMVTAGTYNKEHYLNSPERLNRFREVFFDLADQYAWNLQAWAILSNHYHFVALCSADPSSLKELTRKLHSLTAREINQADSVRGRKIWCRYWDSHITFDKSYYARLNYVHQNAVRHGLVPVAEQYEWCSARWFMLNADAPFRKMISSFKTDKVKVMDDF